MHAFNIPAGLMSGILMRAQVICILIYPHHFLQRLTHIFTVPLCNRHGASASLPVIYCQHYTTNTSRAFKIFPPRCCMHYWSEGFLILLSRSSVGEKRAESWPKPTRTLEMHEDRALLNFRWAQINTSYGRAGFWDFFFYTWLHFTRKRANENDINTWWDVFIALLGKLYTHKGKSNIY